MSHGRRLIRPKASIRARSPGLITCLPDSRRPACCFFPARQPSRGGERERHPTHPRGVSKEGRCRVAPSPSLCKPARRSEELRLAPMAAATTTRSPLPREASSRGGSIGLNAPRPRRQRSSLSSLAPPSPKPRSPL